jgi:DNA-binding Lrp family transcriptional regulator
LEIYCCFSGDAMSRKRKVDLIKIQKLKDAGMSVTDIAKKMDVSKAAISKGFKKLGLSGSQDVILRAATQINTSKINAMAKLERIAKGIEDELTYVEKTMKTTSNAERREWEKTHIGYNAEVRKQLSLLLEISQALYRIEEVDAFKKIVLEELGKIAPEVRDKVLSALKARRSQGNLNIGGID